MAVRDVPALKAGMADGEMTRLTGSVHTSDAAQDELWTLEQLKEIHGPTGVRDKGVGTEATRLTMQHTFETQGLHRVELEVYAFRLATTAIRGENAYGEGMRFEVTESDTAAAVGSGDVAVLATPRLIAWMEAVTVGAAADFCAPEQTTVGTTIRIRHRRPSAVGDVLDVVAETPTAHGSRLTFDVRATDSSGTVVADGEIQRVVVDRERFLGS